MIELALTEDDDPDFVAIIQRIVHKALDLHSPTEVYVVLIDNWFDHKWLKFSGTLMHEIAIWRGKLRIPPFHPSRVRDESHFRVISNAPFVYRSTPAKPLHIIQHSDRNLCRTLKQLSSSVVMVWYSSAGKVSDRGSLMIYAIDGESTTAWYASFRKTQDWRVEKVKGISKAEFGRLM